MLLGISSQTKRSHDKRQLLVLTLVLTLNMCHPVVPVCSPLPCSDVQLERKIVRELGDTATLRCRFAGLTERQTKAVRWYGPRSPNIPLTVGSAKFSLDKRLHLTRSVVGGYQEWALTIDFLKWTDAGSYRCIFNTEMPGFSVQLNVSEPQLVTMQQGSRIFMSVTPLVRLGSSALLECRSDRSEGQDVDLNWDRATRQTKQVDSISLPGGGSELRITSWQRIDNVTLADAGAHTCVKSLIQSGRVLGKAAILLKVRMSLAERLSLEAINQRSLAPPTRAPLPKSPHQQLPPQQPPPQHSWQDPWQQQQQQQPQNPRPRFGSKSEGVILNDAGLTASERQKPPAQSQPDFTYSVPDQDRNRAVNSIGIESGQIWLTLLMSPMASTILWQYVAYL